ncbi:hypothetical protein AKJ16_DCAP23412 [Drosera capensis]
MAAANNEGEEDWEHLHSSSSSSPSSSSSSSQNSPHNLSIFPPINHESLPLLLPPPPSHSPQPSPPPSSPQSTTAQLIQWINLVTQMLNSKACGLFHWIGLCGVSSLSWWGFGGIGGVLMVGFLVWARRRRRSRRELILKNNDERVERLMDLIREKDENTSCLLSCYFDDIKVDDVKGGDAAVDELNSSQELCIGCVQVLGAVVEAKKIIQLLDQIAQLNRVLLGRYRFPVLRTC